MADLGTGPASEAAFDGVEYVHARLRRAILRGDLAAGSTISQLQLSRDLGVSRTPLREAFRLLQREGLVEANRNRSVRVAPCSIEDAEQLYASRIILEVLAIRISIPQMQPEDLAQLGGLMAQMTHFADAADYERWEVPHRAFHATLVAGAGARITTMLTQLSDHAERYRRQYSQEAPRARSASVAEHQAILDACLAGDADAGAARLGDHLGSVATGLIRLAAPGYDPILLCTAMQAAATPLRRDSVAPPFTSSLGPIATGAPYAHS